MKNYTIKLYGKQVVITQNDDGTFNKPKEVLDYVGIGTSIKPAHEPICMARKPLGEKTVAENVLKWETGGINIDGSRVDTITEADKNNFHQNRKVIKEYKADDTLYELGMKTVSTAENSLGRFPANLIHDNSEEVRECFPETKSGGGVKKKASGTAEGIFNINRIDGEYLNGDSGNASRFFKSILYYPKASKAERNKGCDELEEKQSTGGGGGIGDYLDDVNSASGKFGSEKAPSKNTHPTVKSLPLMEYLIKMVTREGGIVFDPFTGSGTTLVAAKKNGFQYLGTEMTDEYIPIIEARLNATELEEEEIIDKGWFG